MSITPLVTVVIPTYNQAHFLNESLQSVCSQTFTDWEAVVINNFSDDDSHAVVEAFDDRRICLVNFRNNGIIGASRNYGISLARGQYLAFLDSDDIWFPDKLAVCVSWLNKGFGLVCHGLRWFGRRERDQFYGPARYASFDAMLYKGNCIATSATVVQKELVESVGMFSEDLKIVTAEDYHLWLKLAKNGVRVDFINQILGGYRFHAANTGTTIKQADAEKYVVDSFFRERQLVSLRDRIRVRFRYGIIEYGIGRSMQANAQFSEAWHYFFNSLALNPFFLKTYIAIFLNILRHS